MCQHLQRYKHHPPNEAHPAKLSSIKWQPHSQQQAQQKHDFDEEPESDPCIPSSSSVKNVISLIGAITPLIGVVISLIGMIVILKIVLAGSIDIAAILLALHMGGTRALEIVLQVLKQKPL